MLRETTPIIKLRTIITPAFNLLLVVFALKYLIDQTSVTSIDNTKQNKNITMIKGISEIASILDFRFFDLFRQQPQYNICEKLDMDTDPVNTNNCSNICNS